MDLARLLSKSLVPIQSYLLIYLEPNEFLVLSQVSRDVHAALKECLQITYNIDSKLRRFFADPKGFRRVQAEFGALIGDADGESAFARKFLAAEKLPDRLHVYVRDEDSPVLEKFLRNEGYWKTLSDEVVSCHHFKRIGVNIDPFMVIVHRSWRSPLGDILGHGPSTAAVNFISWNKAFCLFPRYSLLDRESYLLRDINNAYSGEEWKRQFQQLAKECIKLKTAPWDEEGHHALTRIRRVGDKHTLVVKLDTDGILTKGMKPVPDAVIETATFQVIPEACSPALGHYGFSLQYTMSCWKAFTHPILNYTYIAIPSASDYGNDIRALRHQICESTRLHLKTLPDNQRPADYYMWMAMDGHGGGPALLNWKDNPVPESWMYYDDDLVKQLRELWEKHKPVEKEKNGIVKCGCVSTPTHTKSKNKDKSGADEQKDKIKDKKEFDDNEANKKPNANKELKAKKSGSQIGVLLWRQGLRMPRHIGLLLADMTESAHGRSIFHDTSRHVSHPMPSANLGVSPHIQDLHTNTALMAPE